VGEHSLIISEKENTVSKRDKSQKSTTINREVNLKNKSLILFLTEVRGLLELGSVMVVFSSNLWYSEFCPWYPNVFTPGSHRATVNP
jgi:hypothetical protein